MPAAPKEKSYGRDAASRAKFMEQNASPNAFENDMLEIELKFWESDADREERIKKLWIDLKRKNAIGGEEAVTTFQQNEMNK